MSKETLITKETHVAGETPAVITTENAVLPVQIGSDVEAEIKATQPHVTKETITKEVK